MMTEPSSQDPWSSLADLLGVEPSTEPQPAQLPHSLEIAPPPPPKPRTSARPRGSTNWTDVAGQLGVEVPPEPEPAPVVEPAQGKVESLVRGVGEPVVRPARERSEGGDREQRGGERGEERGRKPRRGGDRERDSGRSRDGRRRRDDSEPRGERDRASRGRSAHGRRDRTPDRGPQRETSDREVESGRGRAAEEEPQSFYEEFEPAELSNEMPRGETFASLELQDSSLQAEESRLGEDAAEEDFGDEPSSNVDESGANAAPASRRRRRRRGRRGVMREDAYLGIERLATEDLTQFDAGTAEPARETADAREEDDELFVGEEISSIEIAHPDEADRETEDSELPAKRRRRRRRGRRSQERPASAAPAHDETFDEDDEDDGIDEDEDAVEGDERERVRPGKRRLAAADSGRESGREGDRSNKNLHREVTAWSEAVGYIISTNMEARARNPSAGQRGRWNRGDRRG